MRKQQLRAQVLDDNLVIADEFELGEWNGQAIMWRILSLDDTTLLAISTDAITSRAFHEGKSGSSWQNSSLRTWLNEEFLHAAFTEEERSLIKKTLLKNPANNSFGDAEQNETCDTVFLLSAEELEEYMPFQPVRTIDGSKGAWWLRTSGFSADFAATVQQDGWVNEYGYEVAQNFVAVRPAIRLELSEDMLLFPEDIMQESDADKMHASDEDMVVEIIPAELPSRQGCLYDYPLMTASAFGEELMLEVLEEEDLSLAVEFMQWFGIDQSWESCLVDELCSVAVSGDAQAIDALFEITGGIENTGKALALAITYGNQSASRSLIRRGASLSGRFEKAPLVNDTPGLAKERRGQYALENGNLYAGVLKGEKAIITLKELISQGALKGDDLRGFLYESARNEEYRSFFAWIMNPDNNPIPGLGARWVKKHLVVAKKSPKSDVAVSAEGLRLFWHPELLSKDPETVRVIAPYLVDPQMEGKRELVCFMAQQGWTAELRQLLQGRKIFTPRMIAAAFEESRKARNRETTAFLADFLRSIGAGKLLDKPEGKE